MEREAAEGHIGWASNDVDGKELHVIGVGGESGDQLAKSPADEARGVADQQETEMSNPGRTETEDHARSSWLCRPACCRALSKKHMFGIAMLILVDLIWVGSAGLTKVRHYLAIDSRDLAPLSAVVYTIHSCFTTC